MNAQHPDGIGAIWELSARRPREWVKRVMTLLEAAIGEFNREEHPAKCTVLQAASLLREQIDPQAAAAVADKGGHLLAWQARKVRAPGSASSVHTAPPRPACLRRASPARCCPRLSSSRYSDRLPLSSVGKPEWPPYCS